MSSCCLNGAYGVGRLPLTRCREEGCPVLVECDEYYRCGVGDVGCRKCFCASHLLIFDGYPPLCRACLRKARPELGL